MIGGMTIEQIEKLCKAKEVELLDKYYGNLIKEAAIECPETIGDYQIDLPLKIEAAYKEYLMEIWTEIAPGIACIFEENKLRELSTDDDREGLEHAYKNATEQTLWERITKTNHKDVTYYKALLKEYTQELLVCARLDFLEEINGKHILNKAF